MNEVMEMLRPAPAAFTLILIAATAPVDAQDTAPTGNFGDWEVYKESEGGKAVCYMGSQPKKAKGKYKKRDETYILVTHRPAEKSLNVISIKAGYAYQSGSEVDVVIGETTFKMFTDAGHAFAYDTKTDGTIVKAMIRGTRMIIKGTSSFGTQTTDTYSLKGFTAAYKAINKACKVKAK